MREVFEIGDIIDIQRECMRRAGQVLARQNALQALQRVCIPWLRERRDRGVGNKRVITRSA